MYSSRRAHPFFARASRALRALSCSAVARRSDLLSPSLLITIAFFRPAKASASESLSSITIGLAGVPRSGWPLAGKSELGMGFELGFEAATCCARLRAASPVADIDFPERRPPAPGPPPPSAAFVFLCAAERESQACSRGMRCAAQNEPAQALQVMGATSLLLHLAASHVGAPRAVRELRGASDTPRASLRTAQDSERWRSIAKLGSCPRGNDTGALHTGHMGTRLSANVALYLGQACADVRQCS